MDDITRLKVILYQFLSFEEERLSDAVSIARHVMLCYDFDSYYVLKYYESVRQFEDFRSFQRKLLNLLTSFRG